MQVHSFNVLVAVMTAVLMAVMTAVSPHAGALLRNLGGEQGPSALGHPAAADSKDAPSGAAPAWTAPAPGDDDDDDGSGEEDLELYVGEAHETSGAHWSTFTHPKIVGIRCDAKALCSLPCCLRQPVQSGI